MAHEHGLITSVLKILILSVVVFFILYFLFPGASFQFFGTSIKDKQVAKASDTVIAMLEESGLSEEEIAKAESALEDPRLKQALIGIKNITAESLSAVAALIKDEL